MSDYARRVVLDISIGGSDVSRDLAPYIEDFSYTDNASGKADEIQLTLHDRDGKFCAEWLPKKGMEIKAAIICADWETPGENIELPCGSFKIDEADFSGPPAKVRIKAVASELCGPLRDTKKTRGWENIDLKTIAGQIASENKLELMYFGDECRYERQDQRNESDLAFVNRLAGDANMNCKTHDGKLILFDADEAENADGTLTIPRSGDFYSPTSWSFKMSSSGTDYSEAEVAYSDPKTGTTHTARVESAKKTHSEGDGKTLTIQRRAENAAHAGKLGKAELRKKNSEEQTSSLEIMGCPRIAAGQTIELTGFGVFSGKYFVKTATHRLTGGYKTSLELTTPSPAKVVKVGNAINEAAEAAKEEKNSPDIDKKNEAITRVAKEEFEKFKKTFPEHINDVDGLIMCLPLIAEAEEKKYHKMWEKDKLNEELLILEWAFKYLKEGFYIWISGKGNKEAKNSLIILYIEWWWLLKNDKVKVAYEDIKKNIFNEASLRRLRNVLKKKKLLTGKTEYFDFISSPPQEWKDFHHQSRTIKGAGFWDRVLNTMDGQELSLGACMLYGLANGIVTPTKDGTYLIKIFKAAIVLYDTFNFGERDTFLGWWSCKNKAFREFGLGEANLLYEYDFNDFRDKYNHGNDFLVISEPNYIKECENKEYILENN